MGPGDLGRPNFCWFMTILNGWREVPGLSTLNTAEVDTVNVSSDINIALAPGANIEPVHKSSKPT